jgi:glycosyltransferase involved in cell wall biosynthesis
LSPKAPVSASKRQELLPLKLVIQIPCYNEEASLPAALAAIPRQIKGVSEIQVLVIDDGSRDRTAEVARAGGAVVHAFGEHLGLAAGFSAGLKQALAMGADIMVNTDADNQYEASDIPALIEPIVSGRADMVIGDRDVSTEEYFSPAKRVLQRIGSGVVSLAAGVRVPDATSGFRAFSRTAAARVIVRSRFSYTLETLIQAGALKQRLAFVPVRTNAPVRPSRLMRSQTQYVRRSAAIILKTVALYRPVMALLFVSAVCAIIGAAAFLAGVDGLLRVGAVLETAALIAFVPLYLKNRTLLRRVAEQASVAEQTAVTRAIIA